METTISIKSNYPQDETRSILFELVEKQIKFVLSRFKQFDKECREFEKNYQMDSNQFLAKFDAGELGDDLQWFDWYAAVRGRNLWKRKYNVLTRISWKNRTITGNEYSQNPFQIGAFLKR